METLNSVFDVSRIHPFAIIHPSAKIHPTVEIGPWCQVGPNVVLGPHNKLLSQVIIDGHTVIGESNVFYPFSVIGGVPQDLKYHGEPTVLEIGDHNTFRESVTINLGTVQGGGKTSIGNHCLLMAYVHIGHDSHVGHHCIISNYGGLAGHVRMENFAILGGMTGVSQYVRIGAYSYVGGQSGLERDVPPFSVCWGSRPTVVKGTNIVGLKRRGFTAEILHQISAILKLWGTSIEKEKFIAQVRTQWGHLPEANYFVDFVASTEVGVIRY